MGKFSAKPVKKRSGSFAAGALIYASVFLLAAVIGWIVLWNFMEAYEQSRPKNTLNDYIGSLSAETMLQNSGDLLQRVDSNLQSEAECGEMIRKMTEGKLRYTKDGQKSSETEQGYFLMAGKQKIGSFTLKAGEPGAFGMTPWKIVNAVYNFDGLLGEPVSVTVPSDYSVSVNGYTLDDSYCTARGIRYALFGDFYESYDQLPTMKTYTVQNYLDSVSVEVRDPAGNPVEMTEPMDWEAGLPECTDAKVTAKDNFIQDFVGRYVAFSGSSAGTARGNFGYLRQLLVPGGNLSQRLATALDGLQFGQSVMDKIVDIQIHHRIPLGGDRYLYDITYLVDTTGKKGVVQTTNNMKVIIAEMNGSLYAEAMASY